MPLWDSGHLEIKAVVKLFIIYYLVIYNKIL